MNSSHSRKRTSPGSGLSPSRNKALPVDDLEASTAETASLDGSFLAKTVGCDACLYCRDRCTEPTCETCSSSSRSSSPVADECLPCGASGSGYFTRCQVRRHNHEGSAWLIAGETIYDATSILNKHPGGAESILRRAGGARDCTRDFEFHSKAMRKSLKKLVVGKLIKCPCETETPGENKEWWVFW